MGATGPERTRTLMRAVTGVAGAAAAVAIGIAALGLPHTASVGVGSRPSLPASSPKGPAGGQNTRPKTPLVLTFAGKTYSVGQPIRASVAGVSGRGPGSDVKLGRDAYMMVIVSQIGGGVTLARRCAAASSADLWHCTFTLPFHLGPGAYAAVAKIVTHASGYALSPSHGLTSNEVQLQLVPSDELPEVPYAVVLPALAIAGWILLSLRRSRRRGGPPASQAAPVDPASGPAPLPPC